MTERERKRARNLGTVYFLSTTGSRPSNPRRAELIEISAQIQADPEHEPLQKQYLLTIIILRSFSALVIKLAISVWGTSLFTPATMTDSRSFLEASIPELIKKLTVNEKIDLLGAPNWWNTSPIDRLKIPSIRMSDGPNVTFQNCTITHC